MIEPTDELTPPAFEGGPDPVWGVGVSIVGLLIMATGGAATWHWTFNIGEGILLLGMTMFLVMVVLSWNAQRKLAEEAAGVAGGAAEVDEEETEDEAGAEEDGDFADSDDEPASA